MDHSPDRSTRAALRLSPQQLHVWRVDLDLPPAALDQLADWLSEDERRRAQRFLRPADRRQFVVSHAAVRGILGQYLGVSPERVETAIGPGGKPDLAPPLSSLPLRYNLSHSAGMAMVALALDREVGVDVERVRSFIDVESIVQRYFAPGERAVWQTLSDGERLPAFFRCWTRKEAYLKARGVGLASGLDQFEVSFAPGEPARLLRSESADSAARWQMFDMSPGGEYIAACVVERGAQQVSVYDWS